MGLWPTTLHENGCIRSRLGEQGRSSSATSNREGDCLEVASLYEDNDPEAETRPALGKRYHHLSHPAKRERTHGSVCN